MTASGAMRSSVLRSMVEGLSDRAVRSLGKGTGRSGREMDMAHALRIIAASMRSGSSLQGALATAGTRVRPGPVASALATAATRFDVGLDIRIVLQAMAEEIDVEAAHLFARVMAVQHRRGGNVGHVCHRLATLLHARQRVAGESRALTSQARFAARVVVVLPLGGVLLWGVTAPASLQRMLEPGMLVIASPAMFLIAIGVLVARSCSLAADIHRDQRECDRRGPTARIIDRLAGTTQGPRRSVRLGLLVATLLLPFVVASRASLPILLSFTAAVLAAVLWPLVEERSRRQQSVSTAMASLPALLEVSIALDAAGATAREVMAQAVAATGPGLRLQLEPAVAHVRLGRSIDSSFAALPIIDAVPELDAWSQILASSDRLGSSVADQLETILRDVRASERERQRTKAATAGPRIQLATVLLIVPGIMWLVLLATARGLIESLAAVTAG